MCYNYNIIKERSDFMFNKKIEYLQSKIMEIKLIIGELKTTKALSLTKENILKENLLLLLNQSLDFSNRLYSSPLFIILRITKAKNNLAQDFRVDVRFAFIDSINKILSYSAAGIRLNRTHLISMIETNILLAEKVLAKIHSM